ncbi:MAG: hypothetical protein SGJ27_28010 [Candidatus Melainabacteria bacterium]|nr:hypothetical protein [Candidatus Melainabacteria bacterium]
MFVSYPELKRILYIGQTVLGLIFLAISWFQFHVVVDDAESVLNFIVAITLLTAGFLCVLFGLDALILRDESDIWQ